MGGRKGVGQRTGERDRVMGMKMGLGLRVGDRGWSKGRETG